MALVIRLRSPQGRPQGPLPAEPAGLLRFSSFTWRSHFWGGSGTSRTVRCQLSLKLGHSVPGAGHGCSIKQLIFLDSPGDRTRSLSRARHELYHRALLSRSVSPHSWEHRPRCVTSLETFKEVGPTDARLLMFCINITYVMFTYINITFTYFTYVTYVTYVTYALPTIYLNLPFKVCSLLYEHHCL